MYKLTLDKRAAKTVIKKKLNNYLRTKNRKEKKTAQLYKRSEGVIFLKSEYT